jgi:hypothetical protein
MAPGSGLVPRQFSIRSWRQVTLSLGIIAQELQPRLRITMS